MKGPSLVQLGLVLLLTPAVWAQSGFDDEISQELDQMYRSDQRMNINTRPQVVGSDEVVNVEDRRGGRNARSGQPIYIYNSATPTSNAQVQAEQGVQQQPVTVVEASPLSESRAEALRKARQNTEMNTEMKIVEELERSRMRDEKRRADKLFGNKLDDVEQEYNYSNSYQNYQPNQNNYQSPQQQNYQNSQPVVVANPYQTQVQTVEVGAKSSSDKDVDIQGEIRAAVADLKKTEEENVYSEQLYVNGLLGFGEYPDAINVKGNFTMGVGVGSQFRDRMLLEGSFLYGNYDVEHIENGNASFYPEMTNMDQYTFGGTFKYQILGGMLRPFVGSTLAYQYRSFTKTQYYFSSSDASSHAVDMGVVLGADIEVSKDFAIGLDYRYLWNIYSRTDTNAYQSSFVNPGYSYGTPIEEMSQSLLSVVGRVRF